jgi:hypothetical protein
MPPLSLRVIRADGRAAASSAGARNAPSLGGRRFRERAGPGTRSAHRRRHAQRRRHADRRHHQPEPRHVELVADEPALTTEASTTHRVAGGRRLITRPYFAAVSSPEGCATPALRSSHIAARQRVAGRCPTPLNWWSSHPVSRSVRLKVEGHLRGVRAAQQAKHGARGALQVSAIDEDGVALLAYMNGHHKLQRRRLRGQPAGVVQQVASRWRHRVEMRAWDGDIEWILQSRPASLPLRGASGPGSAGP